jgi:hypothetical protein
MASGSKQEILDLPLSRFPSGGKPGRAGSPHAGEHGTRQQTTLACADAAGSPRKRDFKTLR